MDFPNLLVHNYLIDCIALASFTHSHALVHRTAHSFWTKNRHSEKVPQVETCLHHLSGDAKVPGFQLFPSLEAGQHFLYGPETKVLKKLL